MRQKLYPFKQGITSDQSQLCYYTIILRNVGIHVEKTCIYWSKKTNIDIENPLTEYLVGESELYRVYEKVVKTIENKAWLLGKS